MSPNRWKSPVLACAIVFAASSVVRTDQPFVTDAKNTPAALSVAVAMANPPRVLDAIDPPVVTGEENPSVAAPPVVGTTNVPTASEPLAVTVAQEPPAAATAPSVAAEPAPL